MDDKTWKLIFILRGRAVVARQAHLVNKHLKIKDYCLLAALEYITNLWKENVNRWVRIPLIVQPEGRLFDSTPRQSWNVNYLHVVQLG